MAESERGVLSLVGLSRILGGSNRRLLGVDCQSTRWSQAYFPWRVFGWRRSDNVPCLGVVLSSFYGLRDEWSERNMESNEESHNQSVELKEAWPAIDSHSPFSLYFTWGWPLLTALDRHLLSCTHSGRILAFNLPFLSFCRFFLAPSGYEPTGLERLCPSSRQRHPR